MSLIHKIIDIPNSQKTRQGIGQKVYTGKVFKDQILPKSASISSNTRSQQNSVNDGKIQKVKYFGVYLTSINFACVNSPSATCTVVETLYL